MADVIPVEWTLILSILIVGVGLYGIFTRRSMIRILIGTELILSAAMLNLVVFSMSNTPWVETLGLEIDPTGLVATLFIIGIAAAETIIGLILLILLYKDIGAIDISLAGEKKEKTRFRFKKKQIAEEAS